MCHCLFADGYFSHREGRCEAPVTELQKHCCQESNTYEDTHPEGRAEVIIPRFWNSVEQKRGRCFFGLEDGGGLGKHSDEIFEGNDKPIDCEL